MDAQNIKNGWQVMAYRFAKAHGYTAEPEQPCGAPAPVKRPTEWEKSFHWLTFTKGMAQVQIAFEEADDDDPLCFLQGATVYLVEIQPTEGHTSHGGPISPPDVALRSYAEPILYESENGERAFEQVLEKFFLEGVKLNEV